VSTLAAERATWAPVDGTWDDAVVPGRSRTRSSPSTPDGAGGEPTLDELFAGVWERLTVHAAVECPLCGGPMEAEYGAHALPVGGRCHDCGTAVT
jgi:hypothetical protein